MNKVLLIVLSLVTLAWAEVPKGPPGLVPLPGASAPALSEVKKVRFVTTAGIMLIEVYPQAAPNAANRFLELVKGGFYDFTPVFRVVPDFVCQFGINWRGDFPKYQENNFKDDPSLFQLEKGTLAFAKAGPDTNSTQVFINYRQNNRLVERGFSAFARVVEGLDIALRFEPVGDASMGLDQDKLWSEGDLYLKKLDRQPAYILFAEVI